MRAAETNGEWLESLMFVFFFFIIIIWLLLLLICFNIIDYENQRVVNI